MSDEMQDATHHQLDAWAKERTHVIACAGYRTERAKAAAAELDRRGLTQLAGYDDEAVLRAVERYVEATDDVGLIVGQVMRFMQGRANPQQVHDIAKAIIAARGAD